MLQTVAYAGTCLEGSVAWIYDGDTLKVAGIGKVRLLGIDVPERKASARDRYFARYDIPPTTLRRIHAQARDYLIRQTRGQTVRLTCERTTRDRYGRLLAYATLADGRLLNRLMLEQGYAVVYRRFEFAHKRDFLRAEAQARRLKRGLWQK
jgi:micrococcal nuclease